MSAERTIGVVLRGYDETLSFVEEHKGRSARKRVILGEKDAVQAWVDVVAGKINGFDDLTEDVTTRVALKRGLRCGDGRWSTRAVSNFGEPPGKLWLAVSALRSFERFNLADAEQRAEAVKHARNAIDLYRVRIGDYRFHIDGHALEHIREGLESNDDFNVLRSAGVRFTDTNEVLEFVRGPRMFMRARVLEIGVIDQVQDALVHLMAERKSMGCGRLLIYADNEGFSQTASVGSMGVLYQAGLEALYEQDRVDVNRRGVELLGRVVLDCVEHGAHLEGAVIEHRHIDRLEEEYDPAKTLLRAVPNSAHGIMAFGVTDGGFRLGYRDQVLRDMYDVASNDVSLAEALKRVDVAQKLMDQATIVRLANGLPIYVAYSVASPDNRRSIVSKITNA